MGLGAGPAEIVAQRRPRPRTRIVWRRDALLELTEWGDGFRPDVAPDARPLPDRPQVIWWAADGAWLAVLESEGRWIRIRTDLGLVELRRIAETLLPYDRLL